MMRSPFLALLLCAVSSVEGQGSSPVAGRGVALLIGTDSYQAREWPRLSSPVLDATTLARTLAGDFSFDTAVVRNATKDDIIRAVVEHGKRATSDDDWSLIFIASHGYFDDDRSQGYLVFRDSKPRSDDMGRSSYLSLTELRAIVEGFRAGHVLLVIDACYAGTIDPDIRAGTDRAERVAGASRSEVESSLQRRSQYRSRMYLTSGGKEYVPDGRPGAHSPFASALLGALRRASNDGHPLTFSQIVSHMAETGIEPIPRHNTFRGHEPGGDFLLVPRSFATNWSAAAPSRATERRSTADPPRGRGSVTNDPPSNRPSATRAAMNIPLVLRVAQSDAPIQRGSPDALIGAMMTHVAADLARRGFTSIHQVPPGATALCPVGPGLPADCIEVVVLVTPTRVSGRQTIGVSITANGKPGGRVLAAARGSAGPYALDVPSDRVATRAADEALEALVTDLVAALGRGS